MTKADEMTKSKADEKRLDTFLHKCKENLESPLACVCPMMKWRKAGIEKISHKYDVGDGSG